MRGGSRRRCAGYRCRRLRLLEAVLKVIEIIILPALLEIIKVVPFVLCSVLRSVLPLTLGFVFRALVIICRKGLANGMWRRRDI